MELKFCTAPASGDSIFVTLIGSATAVNVPATNSIVEAAIQDNQVSEVKLKISNAGTNGYFLQKQSGDTGGLTWAAAGGASSIADDSIVEAKLDIHADPAGTNKFLGYTSNGMEWAVPPDTNTQLSTEQVQDIVGAMFTGNTETNISVTYEDSDGTIDLVSTNTQVGGATGVDFNDDVKARFGTGNDLEIYHDGSDSYIKDTGTGDLKVYTSNFDLRNAAGDETLIDAHENGAVELYYDNVKKAETASWGLNILGNCGVGDSSKFQCGDSQDLKLYHDGTDSHIDSITGGIHIKDTGGYMRLKSDDLKLESATDEDYIACTANGSVELFYDNVKKIETTADGIAVTGQSDFTGHLKEAVTVTAGKLSDNLNLDIANGNVFLFTTAESTTAVPNIRYNGSTTLDSKMAVGDCMSVTIITTANASAFSAQLTIDGNATTENWVGGSAPSGGGSSGVDIHAYTIIKTATDTYTVIANHTKTS